MSLRLEEWFSTVPSLIAERAGNVDEIRKVRKKWRRRGDEEEVTRKR